MELSVLRGLWKNNYPNGNIWIIARNGELFESGKQTGKFGITYNQDGKIYSYTAKSVYKLAERFNLIPDSNIDYFVESKKAIEALLSGNEFESIGGLHDTIRFIVQEKTGKYISFESTQKLDQYDRIVYTFKNAELFESYEKYSELKGW